MKEKKYNIFIGFVLMLVLGTYANFNPSGNTIINICLLVLGFALLIKGADYFVDGASGIADKFGIPQIIIGLTIVAFGTSAPEAAISISSALKGSTGLAIGNVLGSNIMNILLILGIASTITVLHVGKSTAYIEMPFVVFITIVLVALGKWKGELDVMSGIILWCMFIVFFIYLIIMAKKGMNKEEEEEEKEKVEQAEKLPWLLLILFTILGMGAIVIGSNVTVDSASFIATKFGMSDRLIGLTIVAFGTSLPELVTSTIAALKKHADIAIGNIVGSNIFNILFVLGTASLITPVAFASAFIFDGIVAIGVAVLLFLCVVKDKKLSRPAGILMLLCYTAYFIHLVIA